MTPPIAMVAEAEPQSRRRGLWSSEGLTEVEDLMNRLCSGGRLDRLGLILREHLATGGKRLRARLALGTLEALGGRREDAIGWAAACELLHNASLLHDDLQDGDRMRRGHAATWARHGVAQAINAGDLGLMLPYLAIREVPTADATRWQLSELLAENATRVARGQAEELDLLPMRRLSWSAYVRCVQGKTAALFALPIAGAALIAGATPKEAQALADEFVPIGALFQVQDDILDLYGDKGREAPGSDLREGKVSALVVEHLRLHPADEPWLLDLLETPRDRTTDEAVAFAIGRLRDGGALAGVWQRLADVEDAVVHSPVLARYPRLHAVAVELVAMAMAPVAHTAPVERVRSQS